MGTAGPHPFQAAEDQGRDIQLVAPPFEEPASLGGRGGIPEAPDVVHDAIEIERGDGIEHLEYRRPVAGEAWAIHHVHERALDRGDAHAATRAGFHERRLHKLLPLAQERDGV